MLAEVDEYRRGGMALERDGRLITFDPATGADSRASHPVRRLAAGDRVRARRGRVAGSRSASRTERCDWAGLAVSADGVDAELDPPSRSAIEPGGAARLTAKSGISEIFTVLQARRPAVAQRGESHGEPGDRRGQPSRSSSTPCRSRRRRRRPPSCCRTTAATRSTWAGGTEPFAATTCAGSPSRCWPRPSIWCPSPAAR